MLSQGCPIFLSRGAILTHRKYWWAKQTKHPTFCPKIRATSKKRKRFSLKISLRIQLFVPKSQLSVKLKRKQKGVFASNLSSISAKIDNTEGLKKYYAGHSKPSSGPPVGRPCFKLLTILKSIKHTAVRLKCTRINNYIKNLLRFNFKNIVPNSSKEKALTSVRSCF